MIQHPDRPSILSALREAQGTVQTVIDALRSPSNMVHLRPIDQEALCSLEIAFQSLDQALSMLSEEGGPDHD